jgi:protein-tyrosine phosphatase
MGDEGEDEVKVDYRHNSSPLRTWPGHWAACISRRTLGLLLCIGLLGCAGRVLDITDDGQGNNWSLGGSHSGGSPNVASGGSGGTNFTTSPTGTVGGTGIADAAPICLPGRRILVEQAINARDLGGVPLNGRAVSACGTLYRGGPLANLTSSGCQEFDALGIRTVIDLRVEAERVAVPDSPCVFAQASVIAAPLPVPYSLTQEQYLADLNTYASIAAAFDVFGDESAYPIYFHCTYGRDRTGVLAAVVLLALGASQDDIIAEYQLTALTGLYLPPDSLSAVINDIERRGGIEAYLAEAGVTPANVAILRTHATLR